LESECIKLDNESKKNEKSLEISRKDIKDKTNKLKLYKSDFEKINVIAIQLLLYV
jgi:hypothetical protein